MPVLSSHQKADVGTGGHCQSLVHLRQRGQGFWAIRAKPQKQTANKLHMVFSEEIPVLPLPLTGSSSLHCLCDGHVSGKINGWTLIKKIRASKLLTMPAFKSSQP